MWAGIWAITAALCQDAPVLLADRALGADHPFASGLSFTGSLRLRGDWLADPVVDPDGTPTGRAVWGTSRVRVGASHAEGNGAGALEFEVVSGRFGGGTDLGLDYRTDVFAVDRSGAPRDLAVLMPRQAWGGVQGKAGLARVGAQTFTWGTGMLANDGAGDPVFGDAVRGSVVARVLGGLTPWRASLEAGALRGVALLGGVDTVLRDDNADLFAGDVAVQGVVGVRSDAPRWRAGLLGIARWQRDRLDVYHPDGWPRTTAFPVDAHLRVLLTEPDADHALGLEGEAVGITGRTARPWTDETVDGARIRSGGFVARVRYDANPARLTAVLEGGGASGDNDLRDDTVRTFSMHSDHNVGLILFEELMPMLSAHAIDRASDPGLVGIPSPSGRFAVSQGQVSNALYVYPTVRWRFAPEVEGRLGWMSAWSAGDVIDVYQSALNGGYNTTYGGRSEGSHALGHEALAGARVDVPAGKTRIELGAEGALFLPGRAFDGLDLGPLGTARGKVDWRW